MRRLTIVLVLLSASVLGAVRQVPDLTADRDWTAFRTRFRFHIQTVAVSDKHADGSRTLIVSEPPPHVGLEALKDLDPLLTDACVEKHPVGYDGWVKDVVVKLPAASDAQLAALVSKINRLLFFTSYKSSAISISAQNKGGRTPDLDLSVPAGDLRRWLFAPASTFAPLLGGVARPMGAIMRGGERGIFFSVPAGLVVWMLSTADDLAESRVEARQFALDSDLVLGAVGDRKTVAIIGRERVTPTDVVPPLRVETILLLASVETDELAQSYERTNFGAGKFDRLTHADWAPIFLSDELIDTEYGSLLNVTDQLLKGWSLNGTVKYANFDYPIPTPWPFEKPINQLLNAPQLTFNWNTSGAGYAVTSGSLTSSALSRTGALPVSYIPEGSATSVETRLVMAKERDAYAYFATRSDPNLVRVVQYAALYQIFQRFGIHATAPQKPTRVADAPLANDIGRMLREFSAASKAAMAANLKKLMDRDQVADIEQLGIVESFQNGEGVADRIRQVLQRWGDQGLTDLALRVANPRAPQVYDPAFSDRVDAFLDRLPQRQQQIAETELATAASVLASIANPSSVLSRLPAADQKILALTWMAREVNENRSLIRACTGRSVASLKASYQTAMARPDAGWIRTPSIVVSYTGDVLASGGHNLSATVSEVRADATVPRQHVRIVDEGNTRVLLYNPADTNFPHEVAAVVGRYRNARRDALEDVLNASVADLAPVVTVPRNVTLGFTDASIPSVARGLQQQHIGSPLGVSGFTTARQALTLEQRRFLETVGQQPVATTVVERQSLSSTLVYRGSDGRVLEATDTTGMIDALTQIAESNGRDQRGSVVLFRNGFTSEESNAVIESIRLKVKGDAIIELERSTPQDIAQLFKAGEFNPRQARIVGALEVQPRAGRRGFEVTAEIPNRSKLSTLIVKFRVWFTDMVRPASELIALVRGAVGDAFQSASETLDAWSAYRVAADANRALKQRFGEHAVQVIISQTKDYQVVQVFPTVQPVG